MTTGRAMTGAAPHNGAVPRPLQDLLSATGLPLPPEGTIREGAGVSRVEYDSRRVGPGALFVAVPGYHTDGHDFAAQAIARGAVAVVAEHSLNPSAAPEFPVIIVESSRAALAALAAELAGHPSHDLVVAGITGTDGKTTTTTMLHAAWQAAGLRAGSITTVDFRCGDIVEANTMRQTTLEAPELQGRLRDFADAGCTRAAVEVSSHALVLDRVEAVRFGVAVFTRITSEHIDFHGTREAYLAAKAGLLRRTAASSGAAVLDRDDTESWPVLSAIPVDSRVTYSATGAARADLRARDIVSDAAGVRFCVETPWGGTAMRLQLAGGYNVNNALAALAAACLTGAALDDAASGIHNLERVSGRMERVDMGQPFAVVIDYAHTAASLAKVLTELRAATRGRLWAVFGSAGERDRSKRPVMGRVAAELADAVVITDEDPRLEDPQTICEEIAEGARQVKPREDSQLFVIPDRSLAIELAIGKAAPGDTVLLAGKGHEASMIVGREPRPWNERRVVETSLRRRMASRDPKT